MYKDYLQSEHWKTTRKTKLISKPVCQVCCSSSKLNIHHKFYTDILGKEVNSNLVTLCSSCHRLTHKYFGIGVKKLNKKFCRVRRLMELGVVKSKAFFIVSNPELYESIYLKLNNI